MRKRRRPRKNGGQPAETEVWFRYMFEKQTKELQNTQITLLTEKTDEIKIEHRKILEEVLFLVVKRNERGRSI